MDEKIDELRVETKEKISALEEKYLSGKEAEDFESKDGVNYYPKETEKEMQELEASLVKSREEYLIAKRKKPGFFGKLFRKFDKALNSESEEYTLKKEKPTREFIEKEKAYFEIQKAYLEKSGIDVTDFTRDEKIKVKAYELEHASLPEKIKNGVNNGIEYWEKIGENEKDHPFTRRLKKTCKKMISIAVIGGASAVTVSALSGTLVATAGTIATYVGGKMLISGGFGIIAGSLPPEVQAVASTIATGMSAMSVSGLIGYLASKAAESGHDEKSIQEELERRLQELKNTKIEGESLEDKKDVQRS